MKMFLKTFPDLQHFLKSKKLWEINKKRKPEKIDFNNTHRPK